MLDSLLYAGLPYAAVVLFLFGTAVRIARLWRAPPAVQPGAGWPQPAATLGLLLLVLGHAVGFLVPQHVTAFSASPARLLVLEATALVAGLLFAVGLAGMALGRGRVLPQLTGVERLVLALAVLQAVSGVYVATALRWGSSWYVQLLVPWLRSLAALQPDVSAVATMPHAVKAHVLLAVVLLPLLPRTRLPALLLAPVRALRHDVTGRAPRPLEGR